MIESGHAISERDPERPRQRWEFLRDGYPFTQAEFEAAHCEWGCNCGPSALAFVLGSSLDRVRPAIPGFEGKRYTSPSMMRFATAAMAMTLSVLENEPPDGLSVEEMFVGGGPSLVRVQWCGPWTRPGVPPVARYRNTHWVVAFVRNGQRSVFDCNGGVRDFGSWCSEIVPAILESYPKANGLWYPTHRWRVLDVCLESHDPDGA